MKDKKTSKGLLIALLTCTMFFSVVMAGCEQENENETKSNNSATVSDNSVLEDTDSKNTSTESENVTESSAVEDSKDNIKNNNHVSKEETQESTEVSNKTYGVMSFDEAVKIIPEFDKIDIYYKENECYSDERSYNFVCYARIIKDGEKNDFDWQGKHYSFKIGDLIEIQSKISPENDPDNHEYHVNTYIGDYTVNSGMSVSFNPEELEFLDPGYTPTEKDNVVIYPTGDSSDESNISSSNTNIGGWVVKTYVDEFGDQTGEKFLTIWTSDGKYIWNGTDNELGAALLVDKQSAAILLLEYGNSQATNIFSFDNDYIIKTKDSSGNTKTFEGVMYGNGGDRVYLKDYSGFIALLKNGGETKFYVESNINAKYNFMLNLDSFDEVYNQL